MKPQAGEPCVQCGRHNKVGKWICQCGNIVSLDVLRHEKPSDRLPGVSEEQVKADSGTPTGKISSDEQVTLKFDPVHGLSEIFMGRVAPIPIPGVNLFELTVGPIEIYLYSKINGQRSAQELSKLLGLKQVELGVVLLTLMRQGAVTTKKKVSIDTVGGEGAQWKSNETGEYMLASTGDAQKQANLFRSRRDSGDVTGASLAIKRAIAAEPSKEYVNLLEDHLRTAAKRCDELYARARGHLATARPDQAITALQKATAEFRGEAGFFNLLAIAIMAHNKDKTKAILYLEKAVELDPFNPAYSANLRRLKGTPKMKPRPTASGLMDGGRGAKSAKTDLGRRSPFWKRVRGLFGG